MVTGRSPLASRKRSLGVYLGLVEPSLGAAGRRNSVLTPRAGSSRRQLWLATILAIALLAAGVVNLLSGRVLLAAGGVCLFIVGVSMAIRVVREFSRRRALPLS